MAINKQTLRQLVFKDLPGKDFFTRSMTDINHSYKQKIVEYCERKYLLVNVSFESPTKSTKSKQKF